MKNYLLLLGLLIISCNNSDPLQVILENNNSQYGGKMVDAETKFLRAYISDDNFIYHYSLNSCKSEMSEFEKKMIEKLQSENLKKGIYTTPEFRTILNLGLNIIFKYDCDNGISITEIMFNDVNGAIEYIREESEWNDAVDAAYEGFFVD